MPFILDASVVMAWCFEDEATAYADRMLEMLDQDIAHVPAIWPLEVANAVLMGERRQRLTAADALRFIELVRTLPITVDHAPLERALGTVLLLARALAISSYDASYLELAIREGLPLATQDRKLGAAAARHGIPVVP